MNSNLIPILSSEVPDFKITTQKNKIPKEEIEEIISSYSTLSKFDDNKWIIDKINLDQNLTKKERTLYFGEFKNDNLLNEAKQWAIKLILKRKNKNTIARKISSLRKLNNCISSEIESFECITQTDILKFHSFLFNNTKDNIKGLLESWYNVVSFFKDMDFQSQYYMIEKFIIPPFPDKKKKEKKFIPEEIVNRLDVWFKTKEIPIAYNTIYWILRLIPNRIIEVLSMTDKCLKKIDNNTYILSIPTFKQSGIFETGTMKLIEIKYEGIGEYLINLIKEQLQFIEEHPGDNNFLFRSPTYGLFINKLTGNREYKLQNKEIRLISKDSVNRFLKKICETQNFYTNDCKSINVTTHQFRHNGISDRMNSGIFRSIDIKGLTAHHNTKMIEETYTHTSKKNLKNESPIVFRGRIINTDNEENLNKLLDKPFSKRVYKLGICSDIRNCSKDKSTCLKCDYIIPNIDDLDYYKSELNDWKNKKNLADKLGNIIFADLCKEWIEGYEVIIKKVFNALSNENIEFSND